MQEPNNPAPISSDSAAPAAPAVDSSPAPISLTNVNTGIAAPEKAVAADSKAPPAPAGIALPENWRDSLPPDLKAEKSLEMYKDFPSIVKSLVAAQKMIGKDKIVLPDPKHASDDDYREVFKKLGLPDDIKNYDVKLEADSGVDEEFLSKFKERAMAAGVLPRQAQQMLDWYASESKKQVADLEGQITAKKAEKFEVLKQEWGSAFNKHLQAAQVGFADFADASDVEYLNANGLDQDPVLLRIFAKVGMTLKEDSIKGSGGGSGALTPSEAQSKISQIQGDEKHAYHIKGHPSHEAAVQEMQKLFQYVAAGKK